MDLLIQERSETRERWLALAAALRFASALGMGGEWALGVALVMEVWPDRSRAMLAGLIGAASNVGYVLIGLLGLGLAGIQDQLPHWLHHLGVSEKWVGILAAGKGWRLLMFVGTGPALLALLIQAFVPESRKWKEEHARGSTSHWAARDLWGVLVGAGTRLTHAIDITPKTFFAKLVSPFMRKQLPKQTITAMESLRTLLATSGAAQHSA